jgi:hypothetical protein
VKTRVVPLVLLFSLALSAAVLTADRARAARAGAIAKETTRVEERAGGVLQIWWLPAEYWADAAVELGWDDARVEDTRDRLSGYIVLAVLEATPGPEGIRFEEHTEIAERLTLERGGEKVAALRKLDPQLTTMVPDLAYPMRVSLGPLGHGVRLLFFPNLDDAGQPVVSAAREGRLEMHYLVSGESEPRVLVWRPPLTSVLGPMTCPKGGEPLEANWKFCPWHGVPLGGAAGSKASR